MPKDEKTWKPPATLADLHLPPAFVADHCVRTLAAQGALSPVELGKHWRVPNDVASQALDLIRAAGLVDIEESSRGQLETGQRWRLNGAGQARVDTARARTWYAGALPVSLAEFERQVRQWPVATGARAALREALDPFCFDADVAEAMGQAVAAGASLALGGIADDEQYALARALHTALAGVVAAPQAVFAAGAVIRVFDGRVHRQVQTDATRTEPADDELLRAKDDAAWQWSSIARPLVVLSGGVVGTDVVPAFDGHARFYIAPAPLTAAGGLLAVCDAANSDPAALRDLARYWIVPARRGAAILLLRTGERIDIPWQAATLVFADLAELPRMFADAVQYAVDASSLKGRALTGFLAARLGGEDPSERPALDGVAQIIERTGLATRRAAAAVAQYLQDCRAYQGAEFALSEDTLSRALTYAAGRAGVQTRRAA